MKINQQEIQHVSNLEPFDRYQYFLKKVADNEVLYTLQSPNNDWASSTVDNFEMYPIWSASEFASNSKIDGWSEFRIIELELTYFMETVLPLIDQEGLLLNVFPVAKTTGFVVKTNEFIRDINEELENFE
jgi:hypothetical protein